MEANPARSMLSVISHLETAIKAASKNLAGLQQGIDSLNILLAPFADPLPYAEIRQHVQRIFYSLDQLNKIYGIQPSISLELSVPKYLAKKPALIRGKEVGVYQDFQDASNKLLMAFVENAAESNLPYPKLFFKIRKKTEFPEGFEKILNRVYIQNLIPRWQRPNTTYLIDWSRLGPEWKGAKRTTGIPMLQMTTLNLPRLVFEAKSEEQFFSGLEALVEMVKKVNLVSVQQIVGKSCTELDFLNKRIRDDKYCHFDDGVVLLGVLGMHNAVAHLSGSYEMSLVKKILQFLDRKFKYDGIRSGIFEVDFSPIARRFAQLDELRFGRKEKYWGGLNTNLPDDEKIRLMGKLQPLLLGGHLCQLKKMTYEKIDLILKYGIGLAAAERGVYKV
jgi:anaerobic ribonucleoside-triphosphate reductase